MTHAKNARLAGFTLLFYIATGVPGMLLFARATRGSGMVEKLAGIARHPTDLRLSMLLVLLGCLSALVLAVTLYRITCDEDRDLAMLAFACRVAEGIVGASGLPRTLALLKMGTTGKLTSPAEVAAVSALGPFLLAPGSLLSATFFAVGSALFAYLFLRSRTIPFSLAALGVAASLLLAVAIPLQLVGFLEGPMTSYVWLPMLVFELALASWLLIKGVGVAPSGELTPLGMTA